MSGVPVPIAAPGFRDELKGSGLGLGHTPHTHPIGMLALSAVYTYFLAPDRCSIAQSSNVNPHSAESLSQGPPRAGSRSTICRRRIRELKGVVDA